MLQDSTFQINLEKQSVREEFTSCLEDTLKNLQGVDCPDSLKWRLRDLLDEAYTAGEYDYKRWLDVTEQALLTKVSAPNAYERLSRACVIYYHNSNTVKA